MTSSGLGVPKTVVPATMAVFPAYKQGRTSLCADINCLRANTPIDFNIFVGESSAKFNNLWNTTFDQLLTTVT